MGSSSIPDADPDAGPVAPDASPPGAATGTTAEPVRTLQSVPAGAEAGRGNTGHTAWYLYFRGVNTANGNLFRSTEDLSVGARGGDLRFVRSYNSHLSAGHGPFGFGWTHNYHAFVEERSDGSVVVFDVDGSVFTFAPAAGGYEAPPGIHSRLERDGAGFRLLRTDGSRLVFDASGRLARTVDRNGNAVTMAYDGGLLRNVSDDSGQRLVFTYDGQGRVASVTDPLGRTVEYEYETGDLVAVTDVMGLVTRYGYYGNHKLRAVAEPGGATTTYGYDPGTDRVRCVGAGLAATCANGHLLAYDYANDSVAITTVLTEEVSRVTLDDAGSPLAVEEPERTVGYAWDADRNRVRVTNETGTYRYTYDAHGNRLTATDPAGNTVRYDWRTVDTSGQYLSLLESRTDPSGDTTTYRYDDAGNRIEVENAAGATRNATYDAFGNRVSESDFAGRVTRYTYDTRGFRTSVVDPTGAETTYAHDAVGRVVSVTDPRGNTREYEYNARGDLVRVEDPAGGVTTYRYDDAGRLVGATGPDGRPLAETPPFTASAGENATFERDGSSITVTTAEYSRTERVDAAGRPASVSIDFGPFTRTVEYDYDADGNLVRTSFEGGAVTYEYDALDRVTRVEDSSGAWAAYEYDAAGRRTEARYSNGVRTTYAYDDAGRLLRLRAERSTTGGTEVVAEHAYTYDGAGNRLTATDTDGSVTRYGYDALDRLVNVTYPSGRTVEYDYDAGGDRLSVTVDGTETEYVYDSGSGHLERAGNTTYDHDTTGNLREVTAERTANGTTERVTTRYAYGADGRLSEVTLPDGGSATYSYLGTGERIRKTTAEGTRYYLYSAFDAVAEYDADGTLLRRYVHGPGVDEPVAMVEGGSGGDTYFYHQDGTVNVRALTDADGNVANRYRYEPFGEPLETTEAVPNPYRFAGRRYDAETGLYYNRLRYYVPEVGRFSQPDPGGLAASTNPHAYATNNPLRYTDPLGLDRWEGVGVSSGGFLFVVGFSSFDGTFTNLDTGQVCRATMYCGKAGLGLGGSIQGSVTHFDGPTCGKGLRSTSVDFSICGSAGLGVGASACGNFLSDGGQAGAGAGAGLEVEAAFLFCQVGPDIKCSCVDECDECDDDDEPPGNDHPDDNHDLSVLSYDPRYPSFGDDFPDFGYDDGTVAVFDRGFSAELTDFLVDAGESPVAVDVRTPQSELDQYGVLVIPSGGLIGLTSLGSFERKLDTYVRNGGTLVVLPQPRGYQFGPVPGELRGYGWQEDQSCQFASVAITEFCPVLASQATPTASVNVDGYFTEYPADAKVLLSRTKNGMPAMLTYDHGEGRVLASAAYTDWAYGHHASNEGGRQLLRDVVTWAKQPEAVPTYAPGDTVSLPVNVTSYVDMSVDGVRVARVGPDGRERSLDAGTGLSPLESRTVTTTFTIPEDATLGLWDLTYTLENDTYGDVQRIGAPARFAVATFDASGEGWTFRGGNISYSVNSDAEQYAYGSNATFDISVRNRGDRAQNVTVWWAFPHHYWETNDPIYGRGTTSPGGTSPLNTTVTVPPGEAEVVSYTIPVRSRLDRLWAQFYRGNRSSNDYLGRASRGFYGFEPSVAVDVRTDATRYLAGEEVTVDLRAASGEVGSTDLLLTVVDSGNTLVFQERVTANLSAGAADETYRFTLPLDSRAGSYAVVAEALADTADGNDQRVGYDSTRIDLPGPGVVVVPDVPEVAGPTTPVELTVANVGAVDVNGATLNVSLVDPSGATLWTEREGIDLASGTNASFAYDLRTTAPTLGEYRFRYDLTYADRTTTRVRTLSNSATVAVEHDRPTYSQGGTVGVNVTVANDGDFVSTLPVEVRVPAVGFSESRSVTLRPDERTALGFDVPLLSDAPSGRYETRVAVGNGPRTAERSASFGIPASSLDLSLDGSGLAAGDAVPVTVTNEGGVATVADCSLTLYGPRGTVISEGTERLALEAGANDTVAVGLPGDLVHGAYLLPVACADAETGRTERLTGSFDVDGLDADVASTTDAEVYARGEDVTITTTVTNHGPEISGGTLRLRIVDTSAAAEAADEPASTSTTDAGDVRTFDTDGTDTLAALFPRSDGENGTNATDDTGTSTNAIEAEAGTAGSNGSAGPVANIGTYEAWDPRDDPGDDADGARLSTTDADGGGSTLFGTTDVGASAIASPTNATVIETAETWTDRTVVLNESLVINATGSLTLENTSLVFDNGDDGEHGLVVRSGGELRVLAGSSVAASDPDHHYYFQVVSGATFEMRGATVRDAGYSVRYGDESTEGLYVATDGAVIEDSRFEENRYALVVDGANDTRIVNNSFGRADYDSVYVRGSARTVFADNELVEFWTRDAVFRGTNDTLVTRNTIASINVEFIDASNVTARENNASRGTVMFRGTNDSRVVDNVFADSGGAYLDDANRNLVRNNSLSEYADISLSRATHNRIVENRIDSVRDGIHLDGSDHNEVLRNEVTGGPIDLDGSEGNVLRGNDVSGGQNNGIRLTRSADNTVADNRVRDNQRYGIYLQASTNETVRNNTLTGNAWGDFFVDNYWGAYRVTELGYYLHSVLDNEVTGGPLYYRVNESGTTVPADAGAAWVINGRDVTVTGGRQVGVVYTEDSTVRDVNVSGNNYGLYARFSPNLTVADGVATGNRYGFFVFDSDDVLFVNNTGFDQEWSTFQIEDSNRTILRDNLVRGAGRTGFWVRNGPGLVATGNAITDTTDLFDGFSVSDTVGAELRNNTIEDPDLRLSTAISVERSDRITVADNAVDGVRWYAVELRSTTNATVSGNAINATRTGVLLDGGTRDALVTDNRIEGSTGGVLINRATADNVVSRNVIDVRGRGVELDATEGNRVLDNAIRVNSTFLRTQGIGIDESSNNTFEGNTINGSHEYGVLVEESTNTTLRRNAITGSEQGLYVDIDRPHWRLRDDFFRYYAHDVDTSNTIDGRPVYYWVNRTGETVPADAGPTWLVGGRDLTVSNGDPVSVVGVENVTVEALELDADGGRYGLFVYRAPDATVIDTAVSNAKFGIYLEDSPRAEVLDSVATNSTYGVYLRRANGSLLARNEVRANDLGVFLDSTSRTNVTDNDVTGNEGRGIVLNASSDRQSNGNRLVGNRVVDSGWGVTLSAAENNTLTRNVVVNNTDRGIVLAGDAYWTGIDEETRNNLVYDNYVDNPNERGSSFPDRNAEDYGTDNRWNVTRAPGENIVGGPFLGGNYWGDYAGSDTNGDGIGDTLVPYNGSGYVESGGDYLPLIPERSSGPVVFESSRPITVAAGTTETLTTTVSSATFAEASGKLKLTTELLSSRNQTVAVEDPPFYVVEGDTVVTMGTDRETYRSNETVTVSGEVRNEDTSSRAYTLSVVAGGTEVLTESFTLDGGATHEYEVTTRADSTFELSASAGGVTVRDRVEVFDPTVDAELVAPDTVDRDPFDVAVELENTGGIDATVNVSGVGPNRTVTLAPGGSRVVRTTTAIDANTTFEARLTGDVDRTLRRTVVFGEAANVSVAPEPVSPVGLVSVPYAVENTGRLDSSFDLVATVDGQTVERAVALGPGERANGSLLFDLAAGTYTLSYETPFGSGTAPVTVAARNQVTLETTVPERTAGGDLRLNATVENVGPNDVYGTLSVNATGVVTEQEFDVGVGANRTVALTLPIPEGTAPGQHDVTVSATSEGSVLAERTSTLVVSPPRFEVVSLPADRTADAGERLPMEFTVENVGSARGRATLNLSVPGMFRGERSVWLAPGERGTVAVPFEVPDDLSTGAYGFVYRVGETTGESSIDVTGVELNASGSLDRKLYREGDTATLTLEVENANGRAADLFARVKFNGFDETRTFALAGGANETLTFDVPVAFGGDEKVFFGVYTASGRSVHIDGLYPHEAVSENVTLYTDRQVYAVGETVTVTVDPARDGRVAVSAPGLTYQADLNASDAVTLDFEVPALRSGTHYVHYAFDDRSYSYPFDVDGYRVRVLDARLGGAANGYAAGEEVDLALSLSPSRPVTASIRTLVYDEDGTVVDESSTPVDLVAGENEVDLVASLPANASGLHALGYEIDAELSGGTLPLTTGREYFDVTGPVDTGRPPTAAFTYAPAEPAPGEPVTFDASTASDPDGDGTLADYDWDLDGDGVTDAAGGVVTHTFADAGDYDVTLTVTDEDGLTDTTSRTVTVAVNDTDDGSGDDDTDDGSGDDDTDDGSGDDGDGRTGGGGGQPVVEPDGEVEVAGLALLNGTVVAGQPVVVGVDLVNFDPVDGRLTLQLTADGSAVTERTVTVRASSERTVSLRHAFGTAGTYELAVNGVAVGSVTVTAAPTETPAPATATLTPTPASTPTPTPAAVTPATETPEAGDGTPGATDTPTPSEPTTPTSGDGSGPGPVSVLIALVLVALGLLVRRD